MGARAAGLGFVQLQVEALEGRFCAGMRHFFLLTGVLVLFSTALALLDAVSRVAADTLKLRFLRRNETWTLSRLYFALVWTLVLFGAAVLLAGFDESFTLLVLAASLNAFVMFLYSGLLLWLNVRCFRGALRPSPVRMAALVVSFFFFGYFSIVTVLDRLGA